MNICDTEDEHNRYRMPRVAVQHVRGTTLVTNVGDVAKSLRVDADVLMYWWCIELGVTTSTKKLQGEHRAATLQQLLRTFIDQYVLCEECGLPEITTTPKKTYVKKSCAACGHVQRISYDAHKVLKRFK